MGRSSSARVAAGSARRRWPRGDRLLGGLAAGGAGLAILLLGGAALQQIELCDPNAQAASSSTQPAGSGEPRATPFARRDIPARYLRLYQQAGSLYGIDWSVLAGIGWIECDHGRSRDRSCWQPGAVNGAGAGGPMQFLAATWAAYGVDGNHDGRRDRWDARDAVPAAANYLRASGAPGDYRRAIFAYNHADWYVAAVLHRARLYAAHAPPASSAAATGSDPVPVATLRASNTDSQFSFQDLNHPRVTPGWGARGWESAFNDHTTASGIPADGPYPGVSFWHGPTLGGYWAVTFPNARTLVLRQIDTGPNVALHRLVDIDYAALMRAGYTIGSFPTGGPADPSAQATVLYLGRDPRWEALNGTAVSANSGTPAGDTAAACPSPGVGDGANAVGGYVNPFLHAAVTAERIDQGVDYAGRGAITAIGNAVVGYASSFPGWPGNYIAYTLLDGPAAGRSIYLAEGVAPTVRAGSRIAAGQTIASFIPNSPTGIETGWAQGQTGSWQPLAKVTGGYSEGQRTAAGDAFSSFLRALGAPPGLVEGRQTVGRL